MVNVVNPSGEIVSIDAKDLDDALKQNYHIPTAQEEYLLKQKQEMAKSPLAGLGAAGAGAASALTGGLSDLFLKQMGVGQEVLSAEEAHPIATGVGQVGGAVLGAAAPGGEGTIPGMISLAGSGAREATEAIDLAPIIGKTIAKYAPKIIGSAVEGTFYGGLPVSEDVLGDKEANAEKIVANMGLGALIGGAIPALIPAVKGLAKLGGMGVEGGTKVYAKAASIASGATYDEVADMVKQPFGIGGEEGAANRAMVTPEPDLRRNRQVAYTNIDDAHETFKDKIFPWITGKSKDEIFQKMIDGEWGLDPNKANREAARVLLNMEKTVADMLDAPDYGFQVKLKHLDDALSKDYIEITTTPKTAGEAFNILDRQKQNLAQITKDITSDTLNSQDRATIDKITSLYPDIKNSLMDPDAWGYKAAEAQAEMNKGWKDYMNAKKALGGLFKNVGADVGFGAEPITKSTAWYSALKHIGEPEYKTQNELIQKYLDSELELTERAEKWMLPGYDDEAIQMGDKVPPAKKYVHRLSPAEQAITYHINSVKNNLYGAYTKLYGTDKIVELTKNEINAEIKTGVLSRNEDVDQLFDKLNAVRNMPEEQGLENIIAVNQKLKDMSGGHGLFPHLGVGGYGALGFLTHTGPLMTGIAAVAHPETVVKTLAALEKMVNKADKLTHGKVARFVSSAADATQKREVVPAAVMGLHELSYAPDQDTDKAESKKDSVIRIAGELAKFQDPNYALDKVVNSTSGLTDKAPGTAKQVNNVIIKALTFLNEKAPKVCPNMPWESPSLSDNDIGKFEKYLKAIEDPHSILDDLNRGNLCKESIEAADAVYPKWMQSVRNELLSRAGELKKMSYQDRLNYGLMLGAPVEKTTKPEYLRMLAATIPAQQQPQPPPASPPKTGFAKVKEASRHETDIQRLSKG